MFLTKINRLAYCTLKYQKTWNFSFDTCTLIKNCGQIENFIIELPTSANSTIIKRKCVHFLSKNKGLKVFFKN